MTPDSASMPLASPDASRPEADARAGAASGRAASGTVWPWVRVIAGAFVFALALRAFAFDAYRIPSTSMEDTLLVGDFVFVSKLHYGPRVLGRRLPGFGEVERGDVMVFHYPPGLEALDDRTPYIKRVVGLPGDSVVIADKAVRAGPEAVPAPRD
ncbi:MAG: signal peptidase I, partial [Bacteroidota bacterium]